MNRRSRRRIAIGGFVLVWITAIAMGMGVLYEHGSKAGEQGGAPLQWPTDSSIPPTPGHPRVVMFLHPRCPCSRASLRELDRLLFHLPADTNVTVAMSYPHGLDAAEDGELQRKARAIHGVSVWIDRNGVEAVRFGGQTSGHVVAYDARGQLRFGGGITPSRGHEGDSVGRAALIHALNDGGLRQAQSNGGEPAKAAVFGCPLQLTDSSRGDALASETEGCRTR